MDAIIKTLKAQGYRITNAREAVISELIDSPKSIQDVFHSLTKKAVKVDLASIYRVVHLLLEAKLALETPLGNGKIGYKIITNSNHHHNAVCEECGKIEALHLDEDALLYDAQLRSGYLIKKHTLEFFGLCSQCQISN